MRPCINYSPTAVSLWRRGLVPVERFKAAGLHEWVPQAINDGPTYLHFPLGTNPGRISGGTVEQVRFWRDKTQTRHVNIHLVSDVEVEQTQPIPQMFEICVGELCDAFGPENVVAENVVARADGSLCRPEAVDPDVISDVVNKLGCGLLLDTAHLRITCLEMGWDFTDTLMRMPIDRLAEWHVCGCQVRKGEKKMRDSMPMTDEDWRITELVADLVTKGRARTPETVTLEYGGIGPKFDWRTDETVIERDLTRLASIIESW